jgi:hypothetical protein
MSEMTVSGGGHPGVKPCIELSCCDGWLSRKIGLIWQQLGPRLLQPLLCFRQCDAASFDPGQGLPVQQGIVAMAYRTSSLGSPRDSLSRRQSRVASIQARQPLAGRFAFNPHPSVPAPQPPRLETVRLVTSEAILRFGIRYLDFPDFAFLCFFGCCNSIIDWPAKGGVQALARSKHDHSTPPNLTGQAKIRYSGTESVKLAEIPSKFSGPA